MFLAVHFDYYAPFSLITQEALSKMKLSLSANGIIIINLISAIEGSNNSFFQSLYSTYRSIFSDTYIFQVDDVDKSKIQNIILIAFNGKPKQFKDASLELTNMIKRRVTLGQATNGVVLTDGYAPVESMHFKPYSTRSK